MAADTRRPGGGGRGRARPSWSAGRPRPDQIQRGRHGLSPNEVAELQRERIVAATVQLVARDGYEAVRVADVTSLAGVSRKSYYELFEGREQGFGAAFDHTLDRLLGLATAAFDSRDAWVDRLRAAVAALLGALAQDPGAARICFYEPLVAGPHALERRNRAMGPLARLLHPAEERRGRADRPTQADEFGGIAAVGILGEVLQREVSAGRTSDLPALAPRLMHAFVLPVLGPAAAARELDRATS